jgi:hydroxyethylthiazole kinase-like uncharacterized protein yjeF
MKYTVPVLSCHESVRLERRLLLGEEQNEWRAMSAAGRSLARLLLQDYLEIGQLPETLRVLVLAGKGHNAGDALLAAREILSLHEDAFVQVVFAYGRRDLKPLAMRAYKALEQSGGDRVSGIGWSDRESGTVISEHWNACIDGIVGMQFSPPIRAPGDRIITEINASENIDLRAAVDLPSGMDDSTGAEAFRADFTYATGIAKSPLFESANRVSVGRVRFIDLGFFKSDGRDGYPSKERILLSSILDPLRRLRNSNSEKRSYGHLFIVGGSRSMPGAVFMAAQAAVRSGVGLVTAFVPESVSGPFASVLPEAMWVPWPETRVGGLSATGFELLERRLKRATCILAGPGMGDDRETQTLLTRICRETTVPIVFDADALRKDIVCAARAADAGEIVITPHRGEYARLSGGTDEFVDVAELRSFSKQSKLITVLKGPITRITDGSEMIISPFGGPLLARGGSGDILSGLIGGRIAQPGADTLTATCEAVALHGLAADALSRRRGTVAVRTTELIGEFGRLLRDE